MKLRIPTVPPMLCPARVDFTRRRVMCPASPFRLDAHPTPLDHTPLLALTPNPASEQGAMRPNSTAPPTPQRHARTRRHSTRSSSRPFHAHSPRARSVSMRADRSTPHVHPHTRNDLRTDPHHRLHRFQRTPPRFLAKRTAASRALHKSTCECSVDVNDSVPRGKAERPIASRNTNLDNTHSPGHAPQEARNPRARAGSISHPSRPDKGRQRPRVRHLPPRVPRHHRRAIASRRYTTRYSDGNKAQLQETPDKCGECRRRHCGRRLSHRSRQRIRTHPPRRTTHPKCRPPPR